MSKSNIQSSVSDTVKDCTSSEDFDQILLQQLADRNRVRKYRGLAAVMLFTAMIIGLYVVFNYFYYKDINLKQKDFFQIAEERFHNTDIDSEISALKNRLQSPGRAIDYYLLGEAFKRRFESRSQSEDALKAVENFHRFDELVNKQLMEVSMNKKLLVFIIPVFVLLGLVSLVVLFSYNGLVSTDEQADSRWGQVEAALQRRLDLVPQLVETVRGYAAHEERTLTNVTNARLKLADILSGKIPTSSKEERVALAGKADADFQQALRGLAVVVENYPTLKANSNFLTLQEQLEGTENRINTERVRFNESVRDYNTVLRKFPGNITAGLFEFNARAYFESTSEAAVAPTFSFK